MIFYFPYSTITYTKIEARLTFLTLNQVEVYFNDQNGEVFKQIFTVSDLKQISEQVVFCVTDKPPYPLFVTSLNLVKRNQFVAILFDIKPKAIDFRECDVYISEDINLKFDVQGIAVQEWGVYSKTHKIFFLDDNTYEWIFPYYSSPECVKLASQFYSIDPTSTLTNKAIIKTTSATNSLRFKICTDVFGDGDTQEELKFASYNVGCISPSGAMSTLTPDSTKIYTVVPIEKGIYKIFPLDNSNHRIDAFRQINSAIHFSWYAGLLPLDIYVI